MAHTSLKQLTRKEAFALMDRVSERKYSTCFTCDEERQIESVEEAEGHRSRGHVVLDYCDYKAQYQVVN